MRALVLATIVLLSVVAAPGANAQTGIVEGRATTEDGAPVQFALVQLVHVESSPARVESSRCG